MWGLQLWKGHLSHERHNVSRRVGWRKSHGVPPGLSGCANTQAVGGRREEQRCWRPGQSIIWIRLEESAKLLPCRRRKLFSHFGQNIFRCCRRYLDGFIALFLAEVHPRVPTRHSDVTSRCRKRFQHQISQLGKQVTSQWKTMWRQELYLQLKMFYRLRSLLF